MVALSDQLESHPPKPGSSTYDAFNRRIHKAADTDGDGAADDDTWFVYGGQAAWQVLEEWDGPTASAELTASHVYGLYIDEVLTTRRHDLAGAVNDGRTYTADEDFYYHQDDLYSVVAVTDDAGTVAERYEYGDYGDPRITAEDGTARVASLIKTRHLYDGYLHDGESGFYHVRYRSLWPEIGRWVQRDPLVFVDGMNLMQYATCNPITKTDPYGSEPSWGYNSNWGDEDDGENTNEDSLSGFMVIYTNIEDEGSSFNEIVGILHTDITHNGLVVHVGNFGSDERNGRDYRKDDEYNNIIRKQRLRKRRNGALPDGTPCSEATVTQIINCLMNESAPTGMSSLVNNCQTGVADKANKCCLSGGSTPASKLRLFWLLIKQVRARNPV